jgi:small subunit ribosomal protein S20
MANSKQQRKRVRVSERQRLENRRYRGQIKTLFRRLGEAIDAGDGELIESAHRRLLVIVDRAAARHAIHRNTAARRKSQAARIKNRAGAPSA